MLINKSTIQVFLSIFFYKITLDLSYYFITARVGDYVKFGMCLDVIKLFESYFLLFFILILLPKSSKKLSNIIVWLIVLLSYVPMLTIFAFMDSSRIYMYAVSGFWVLLFFLLKMPGLSIRSLSKKQSKVIYYSLFISSITIVFFLIYKYLGLSFNLDFNKVYDIRSVFVDTGIPLAGYLFTWTANVINPVFFALFRYQKKWLPIIPIIFLQFLLFSVTGNKAYLFALPFVLMLTWIVNCKNPLIWMARGLTGAIFLSLCSYWLINDLWVYSLFTRRVLFLPAHLSFIYYDFFSNNSLLFLSQHSIFQFFSNYPYDIDIAHLIGKTYFNRPDCNANNGIYADAYMNFGFIGLVLWSALLAIILKLVDSFSKNKNIKITIAAIALPVITLINTSLSTVLLTHGLLLALLLLYLLPKKT